jgi:hypothetical protein
MEQGRQRGWRCGCACPTGRLRDRPRRRGTAVAARRQHRALSCARLRGGARNPRWWDLDTPKVFRRPGTNFRYRREPPSNFRVCPLFGTPPSIRAPGELEKPPKSDSFSYETSFVGCSLIFYYSRFCIRLHFRARTVDPRASLSFFVENPRSVRIDAIESSSRCDSVVCVVQHPAVLSKVVA